MALLIHTDQRMSRRIARLAGALPLLTQFLLASVPLVAHGQSPDQEQVVVGPTYRINEPDFLKTIERKLKEKERSGELARLQREGIARSQQTIEHPKPVEALRNTTEPRSYYFDPSIVVTKDLATPDGKIIAPGGTRVNPLQVVHLSRDLLFFDERDKDQVSMAKRIMAQRKGRVKPILTGGSYMGLMREWKSKVYYDQGGALVTKLGIRQVPALVTQDGLRLRIDEMRVLP